jgi:hypothetical protein
VSECTSQQQYTEKFFRNQFISGIGFGVEMHVPCPFCAEPDWLVHKIVDTREAYSAGAVCKHCDRGCRALFKRDAGGGVSWEFVQTSGRAAPSFVLPMRRDARAT